MDWSKAKNLIIGMLVVVNAFLLFVCFFAERGRLSVQETAVANTVAYLADRGTEIDPAIIPLETDPRSVLLIERDDAAEANLAETLIGGKEFSRIGGIVRFSSGDGGNSALWRAGGLFEASVSVPGSYQYEGDVLTHPAIRHLTAAGITAGEILNITGGELGQMVLCQYVNEQPVFNATLTVTCHTENMVYAAGRWCVGASQAISAEKEMDIPGLLIRFAEQMSDSDADLSRIEAIRAGYVAQSIASTGLKLIPAWEITTPAGVHYISAVDGTILVSE